MDKRYDKILKTLHFKHLSPNVKREIINHMIFDLGMDTGEISKKIDIHHGSVNNLVNRSKFYIEYIPVYKKSPINELEIIKRIVIAHFMIDPKYLFGNFRFDELIFPRQVAHYISRMTTDYSLSRIASEFGRRDSATASHSIKMINNLEFSNKKKYNEVQDLLKKCKKHIINFRSQKSGTQEKIDIFKDRLDPELIELFDEILESLNYE